MLLCLHTHTHKSQHFRWVWEQNVCCVARKCSKTKPNNQHIKLHTPHKFTIFDAKNKYKIHLKSYTILWLREKKEFSLEKMRIKQKRNGCLSKLKTKDGAEEKKIDKTTSMTDANDVDDDDVVRDLYNRNA